MIVVEYIAGFIVRRIQKALTCNECAKILTCDTTFSSLQRRKEYGKLIKKSTFVITCCKTNKLINLQYES